MELNNNGMDHNGMDPYSADGGGEEEKSSWLDNWLNLDKWSWWFKYAAAYVVVVYACLIVYQILSPKETNIEKLKNMIDRDEKWAEVQSSYNNTPSPKTEPEKVDAAAKPHLAKSVKPFGIFTYLNEIRIQLLTSIWEWLRDNISDFIARRSARIGGAR